MGGQCIGAHGVRIDAAQHADTLLFACLGEIAEHVGLAQIRTAGMERHLGGIEGGDAACA
jgi:hypothetical protein